MKLLLGSGGFSTEARQLLWRKTFSKFLEGTKSFLFIPYALQDHDAYSAAILERRVNAGIDFTSIHTHVNPISAIEKAEAIFIGGGNSFRLLKALYDKDLIEAIRAKINNGTPYIGISAGTNMACPTIMNTNDMPITYPPSFDALNLIPFQINPHYFSGQTHIKTQEDNYIPYGGETRDLRINQYHEENDLPVLGLWEGSILEFQENNYTLHGPDGARLFRKGKVHEDLEAGDISI